MGLACALSAAGELPRWRERMPDSFFLVRTPSTEGMPDSVAAGLDVYGRGILMAASRDLTCCYLRDPWRARFAPAHWDRAVAAATTAWIAQVRDALPSRLEATLPV